MTVSRLIYRRHRCRWPARERTIYAQTAAATVARYRLRWGTAVGVDTPTSKLAISMSINYNLQRLTSRWSGRVDFD